MLFSFFDIYSTNLFLDSLPTVISIFLLLAAYHYNPIYVVIVCPYLWIEFFRILFLSRFLSFYMPSTSLPIILSIPKLLSRRCKCLWSRASLSSLYALSSSLCYFKRSCGHITRQFASMCCWSHSLILVWLCCLVLVLIMCLERFELPVREYYTKIPISC